MAWYKTTLSRKQIEGDKGKKVAEKLRGLERVWQTPAYRQVWLLDEQQRDCSAGAQWDNAGNHFAELQVVEASSLGMLGNGLDSDDVTLLVHSGSRGYGSGVLKRYTTETRTSLQEDSADVIECMKEHDKACQWAKANRDLIALRFLSCLEPGNECWRLGNAKAANFGEEGTQMIGVAKRALQQRKVVDIWHNSIERVPWPPTELDATSGMSETEDKVKTHDGVSAREHVYMHRPRAAPTQSPTTRVPLIILSLPGSRGTPTLILQPTFSASTWWGLKNGLSLAHGAGRAMSRAKALSTLSRKYKDQNILEPRWSDPEGTWVICDEKDVEAVGQDLADAGAANIVGWCLARISYKVRKERWEMAMAPNQKPGATKHSSLNWQCGMSPRCGSNADVGILVCVK